MGKKKIHTRYNLKDGTRVPGATTIGGILDKFGLVPAAVKLTRAGMDYKKVWEEKAEIGTLTHSMILAHLKKTELDTLDYTPNQAINKNLYQIVRRHNKPFCSSLSLT